MLRFFLLVSLLLLLGIRVLEQYAPAAITQLAFLVFGIIALAVMLKVGLDFYLSWKEAEQDEENQHELTPEEKPEIYYSIESFTQARKRKDQRSNG